MTLSRIGAICLLTAMSSHVEAAGYGVWEQSVTGLGKAFAGIAAAPEDASTIFFNPAGLQLLENDQFLVGVHYINARGDFKGQHTFMGFNSISGSANESVNEGSFLPNLYYARKINNKVSAGLGINSPFGLVTEYDDDWQGRYIAVKSEMLTINFNPSLAFQATDKLSVGFGVNLQYVDVELTQAVDFGAVCAQAMVLSCATPGSFASDGRVKLAGDDWSWGYNLGLIYQLSESTRLGLSYRSKISHELKGTGKFSTPDRADVAAVAGATGFQNGSIRAPVTNPESASVALFHQINDIWSVSADASWTRWSRFQQLEVKSDQIARLNSTKDENWDNSFRYGIGLTYQPNTQWTFRSGIAYEETPIPNRQYVTPRIPDSDRVWLSFGASYVLNDNIIIDGAYTHIFTKDVDIDNTDGPYNLSGKFDTTVDILSVQLRWLFN